MQIHIHEMKFSFNSTQFCSKKRQQAFKNREKKTKPTTTTKQNKENVIIVATLINFNLIFKLNLVPLVSIQCGQVLV